MITKYFAEKLNQQVIPEVSDPTQKYCCWDDGGVEGEVGEFLYGLVKVYKPLKVLETGLFTGISCSYIAQGLKDNGFGQIHSVEIDEFNVKRATQRLVKLELDSLVQIYHMSSQDFIPQDNYDLMILDTEPNLRFGELLRFFSHLNEGGMVFIHDLHRPMCQDGQYPFGKIEGELEKIMRSMHSFHLPTPRGLTGFYKPHPQDYL